MVYPSNVYSTLNLTATEEREEKIAHDKSRIQLVRYRQAILEDTLGFLNVYEICWDKNLFLRVSVQFHLCTAQTPRINLSTEFQSQEKSSTLWPCHSIGMEGFDLAGFERLLSSSFPAFTSFWCLFLVFCVLQPAPSSPPYVLCPPSILSSSRKHFRRPLWEHCISREGIRAS